MSDEPSIDLRPRTAVPSAQRVRARRAKRWPAVLVLVLVLVGGGVLVTQFLTSAIDYFCNVDELGVKDSCEAGSSPPGAGQRAGGVGGC